MGKNLFNVGLCQVWSLVKLSLDHCQDKFGTIMGWENMHMALHKIITKSHWLVTKLVWCDKGNCKAMMMLFTPKAFYDESYNAAFLHCQTRLPVLDSCFQSMKAVEQNYFDFLLKYSGSCCSTLPELLAFRLI